MFRERTSVSLLIILAATAGGQCVRADETWLVNPDFESETAGWGEVGLAIHSRYSQPNYSGQDLGEVFGVVFSTGQGIVQQTEAVFQPVTRYRFRGLLGRYDHPGTHTWEIGYLETDDDPASFRSVAKRVHNSDGRRWWSRVDGVELITPLEAPYLAEGRKVAVRMTPALGRKGAVWCDNLELRVGPPLPNQREEQLQGIESIEMVERVSRGRT